jgi:hypothetical protein
MSDSGTGPGQLALERLLAAVDDGAHLAWETPLATKEATIIDVVQGPASDDVRDGSLLVELDEGGTAVWPVAELISALRSDRLHIDGDPSGG